MRSVLEDILLIYYVNLHVLIIIVIIPFSYFLFLTPEIFTSWGY